MTSSKDPQVPPLKTIEAALQLVDAKKESLKKAFDNLQAQSFLSSSFSLSWPDIDSHFTSLQNTLTHRFHLLQSRESSLHPDSALPQCQDLVDSVVTHNDLGASKKFVMRIGEGPPSSFNPPSHDRVDSDGTRSQERLSPLAERDGGSMRDPSSSSNPATHAGIDRVRLELMAFCEKMDGKGLRNHIHDNPHKRDAIRAQLQDAMRVSLDQGTIVLDALEDFYSSNSNLKGDKDVKLSSLRRTCIDLLEVIIRNKPNLSDEVRERAKKLALEWKEKVNMDGDPLEALGLLNLLVAYNLQNEFDAGELVDYFVVVARFKQAALLSRAIGLGEKTADFIQKLIDNGKQFLAVKFIFEFGMVDKFPPVPLLKAHLKVSRDFTKKVCSDGKSSIKTQNEARSREINALKTVLKVVDEHNLGSEYPRVDLEKCIEMLEKQKLGMKRPAPSADKQPQVKKQAKKQPKKQAKKLKHSVNRRGRPTAVASPAAPPTNIAGASSSVPSFQQSRLQQAGLFPATGMYGIVGSTPAITPYGSSSAGPYGLAGADRGFARNPSPAGAQLYYPESQVPPGYYDRPLAYDGYALPPQYHTAYYPQ